ncbi:hypothetical protein [Metallibacterium sp.]
MERLSHNHVIRITEGQWTGIFRVILDEVRTDRTVLVRLEARSVLSAATNQLEKASAPSSCHKKRQTPLIGALLWFDRRELVALHDAHQLHPVEIEPEAVYLVPLLGDRAQACFEKRKKTMTAFLQFDQLRDRILAYRGLSELVSDAMQAGNASRVFVYKCWSLLCRHGITESSLRPRHDRCGAPGVSRPCDPGGRQKAGRWSTKQRIAAAVGKPTPPEQPGMNSDWRSKIMAADRLMPSPKPLMPERCDRIVKSHFIRRFRFQDDQLVEIKPGFGEYPNRQQIQRVLEVDIPRLQRLLQRTTEGHFKRSLRGAAGRSWKGVAGPGHTWAVDSTIGDMYLRSSINRAWILGRPVVYVLVDVWSTAVVGFYVCLDGPSWATAKLSLFCSGANPILVADLWGYQPMGALMPAPTLPAMLMCDRGEYLSRAARQTGVQLLPMQSYAPPYRPDLKGLVEVLHRIEKDKQYHFVPGAIDARRAEYELRRFDPTDSVLTVRDYVHYLYTMFSTYNLTANRQNRLDAHMRATGVFPSPAGLWRWGHEVGIGFRRHVPQAEIITTLLPGSTARITRSGIQFAQRDYVCASATEQQWFDQARNFGGWDIPCQYFPGSVGRIWTPSGSGAGMLELQLSDQSTASPELTFDEVVDAFEYARTTRAQVEHANTMVRLASLEMNEQIVSTASELTAEAESRHNGTKPSMTESRQLEIAVNAEGLPVAETPAPAPHSESNSDLDQADESYLITMRDILADLNQVEDEREQV